MQAVFDFGEMADVAWIRSSLRDVFGACAVMIARDPTGQLVKSMISSRTRDVVSLAAYARLAARFPDWPGLAAAAVGDIEDAIHDVTFADRKARHVGEALRIIAADHPDFDLGFLGHLPVATALHWLERLPSVGRKVSAATLNFSILRRPAFVVDTHVLRVLRRFGLVGAGADIEGAYTATMSATCDWSAAELAEFHVLVKRLGQTLCRHDNHCCRRCPLRLRCATAHRSA